MRLIAVHYVLGQLQQVAAQVRRPERERGGGGCGAATESEEINASLKRNRKSGSEREERCRNVPGGFSRQIGGSEANPSRIALRE